jgi:hypothetical protein
MSTIVQSANSYFITTAAGQLDENVTVSADKSRVTLNLERPNNFSSASVYTTIEVEEASIWNTSPNISAALANNKFDYLIGGVPQPSITIPDGLYSVSTLNAEIVRQISNVPNPSTTVTMTGNSSTQKVILIFDATVQVDFTQPNSVRPVLGFNATLEPAAPAPFNGFTVEAPNIAAFNNTNTFNILSNIVSNGIPINNFGRSLIANIPITANVGSIVNYAPFNPTKVLINERRGKSLQQFYIQITDDDGAPLPQTEDWSITITFRQSILLSDKPVPIIDLF